MILYDIIPRVRRELHTRGLRRRSRRPPIARLRDAPNAINSSVVAKDVDVDIGHQMARVESALHTATENERLLELRTRYKI